MRGKHIAICDERPRTCFSCPFRDCVCDSCFQTQGEILFKSFGLYDITIGKSDEEIDRIRRYKREKAREYKERKKCRR